MDHSNLCIGRPGKRIQSFELDLDFGFGERGIFSDRRKVKAKFEALMSQRATSINNSIRSWVRPRYITSRTLNRSVQSTASTPLAGPSHSPPCVSPRPGGFYLDDRHVIWRRNAANQIWMKYLWMEEFLSPWLYGSVLVHSSSDQFSLVRERGMHWEKIGGVF